MTKGLVILYLLLHSCTSDYRSNEIASDKLNQQKTAQTNIGLTSNKKMTDSTFMLFWEQFIKAVKTSDVKAFKKMSLDSLEVEDRNVHIDIFLKNYYPKIFNDSLFNIINDAKRVEFIDSEVEVAHLPAFISKQIQGSKGIENKVNITKVDKYPEGPVIIIFEFIKTEKGYRLYGYDRVG